MPSVTLSPWSSFGTSVLWSSSIVPCGRPSRSQVSAAAFACDAACLSQEPLTHPSLLSHKRAFTPVFDGLWGEGAVTATSLAAPSAAGLR